MTNYEARRKAVFTHASTAELIKTLRALDHLVKTTPTPEYRLSRAWVQTELEERFPSALAAVERAYEQEDETVELDQVEILLSAITQLHT